MAIRIEKLDYKEDVYDIEVNDNHNFYANGILVHNCEINLPTKPLEDINDTNGEIALCTLASVNMGKIKTPEDFARPCTVLVRALDALLDYQDYPVEAARISTMDRRPLGIGVINLAYWLAKNNTNYSNPNLDIIHEYMEAWSYYLLKASNDLAKEFGACPKFHETLYAQGKLPIDTYKEDVDELVAPVYRMDWETLRADIVEFGMKNSVLMAQAPTETSASVSNSTNGIEPPRSLVSIKQSKDGSLKQVVPEFHRLKNKYELLWDQQSPIGYLSIAAVMQKFIDQSISTNTSYNPIFFEDEEIPMSLLLNDMLFCYKYGIKTGYYMNIADGAGEIEMKPEEEESCDSCKI